jgi:hypothetical protein
MIIVVGASSPNQTALLEKRHQLLLASLADFL